VPRVQFKRSAQGKVEAVEILLAAHRALPEAEAERERAREVQQRLASATVDELEAELEKRRPKRDFVWPGVKL
jgi:hypothetical protein